ncbi:MAG: hypothetical protein EOR46_19690 [Mesorhizobium sp.]|nr:MAG: hypothetical protein EOR46_19690 [Mesorhizobium sp.]RWK67519.1 MAG: hypothetical protein EOR54_18775 [Mesorhizobium sp.]RWK78862.1 MAG: hypothetical protein EOR50_08015 [Mesorhizobium sp.]RWK82156.1 MAG: hypothetical protein EOR51_13105 [Mesorhizobium sp.]RWL03731.1 MAG: hypothetical protein EOR55_18010 [Mesorhizobium sp.]
MISSYTTRAGAVPHPPAGTFSPYSDGEKGQAPTLATPSPVSIRGEGKGEGQRRRRQSLFEVQNGRNKKTRVVGRLPDHRIRHHRPGGDDRRPAGGGD